MSGVYNNKSATSSQSSLGGTSNNNVYDIDSFLDFSAGGSVSPTSQSLISNKSGNKTTMDTIFPNNMLQQSFPAPSFQYDSFPQQTGPFPSQDFTQNSSPSTQPSSFDTAMDFTSMDNMFMFPDNQTLDNNFVDPTDMNFDFAGETDMDTLAGIKTERSQSSVSTASESSAAPSRSHHSRKSNSSQIDAATEERIKQILDDVKRRAHTSTQDSEDIASPQLHLAKMKKDEEDMDEDERLLASEEGKKLSSKERRQLRNKVSARAFRSRRKEYIGQLENEVAIKNTENSELREKNKAIEAENKSLKDLTRMLLASPQFSAFLDQLHPATATNGRNLAAMVMPQQSHNDNVTVHRASVPEVSMQQPLQQMPQEQLEFQPPTYIPPQQYMPTYNPRKDTNPHQVINGVQEWPLAYGTWGMGAVGNYTAIARPAQVSDDEIDAVELAGKSLLEDALAPVDGFRPGFSGGIPNEKNEAEPDYLNSYDANGQYIFNVFEDELEDVPDFLYDHFHIHAPLGEEKQATPAPAPAPESVLPKLGLAALFSDLEKHFTSSSQECTMEPTTEDNMPTQVGAAVCRNNDLQKSIAIVENTYHRIGVFCGM